MSSVDTEKRQFDLTALGDVQSTLRSLEDRLKELPNGEAVSSDLQTTEDGESKLTPEQKLVKRVSGVRLEAYFGHLVGEERDRVAEQIEENLIRELDYGAIRAEAFDSFGQYLKEAKEGGIGALLTTKMILKASIAAAYLIKAISMKSKDYEAAYAIHLYILKTRAKIEVIEAAIAAAQNDFGLVHKLGREVIEAVASEREQVQQDLESIERGSPIDTSVVHLQDLRVIYSDYLRKLDLREQYARDPRSMPADPYPDEDKPTKRRSFLMRRLDLLK